MNPARVAVTSRSFSNHPILRSELLQRYSNVTFNDSGKTLAGQELIDFLRGHEKAITALEKLDRTVFRELPELTVISKYGVGLDMIDLEAMKEAGVRLGWTPGVNRRSVAELVVAAAIALLHRVTVSSHEVQAGRWKQIVGRQLTGRTVGIIGCGHIGREVAVLMKAFDCSVVANDIVDYREFYERHGVEPRSLDDLLHVSDVVTLHVPLDGSTANMLSAARLRTMKKGAVLINMARGGLVDENEVKSMLLDGHLAGAGFDVFSQEPPEDRELISLPNVWATAHIGGSTEEAILGMGRAAIDGLDSARDMSAVLG